METGPIIIQIHSDLPGEESKTLYPAKIVWSAKQYWNKNENCEGYILRQERK